MCEAAGLSRSFSSQDEAGRSWIQCEGRDAFSLSQCVRNYLNAQTYEITYSIKILPSESLSLSLKCFSSFIYWHVVLKHWPQPPRFSICFLSECLLSNSHIFEQSIRFAHLGSEVPSWTISSCGRVQEVKGSIKLPILGSWIEQDFHDRNVREEIYLYF